MSDTRWVRADFDPTYPWPEPPKGARVRTTLSADHLTVELIEFEAPRLPAAPGWYRHPKTFGAVFHRDDDTWLDANGNRVDTASLPDGLIRLIDASTEPTTSTHQRQEHS
jgi:hypothetical protein